MAEDLYDDGGGSDSATIESPAEKPSEKKEGAATGLLSKDFFGGKELKPGTRCEIEVDRILDDQVMVRKVPESDYSKPEESMMPAESEDMMA